MLKDNCFAALQKRQHRTQKDVNTELQSQDQLSAAIGCWLPVLQFECWATGMYSRYNAACNTCCLESYSLISKQQEDGQIEITYGEHPTCSLKNNVFINNNGINSLLIICVSTCWQLVLVRNIQQTCNIHIYIQPDLNIKPYNCYSTVPNTQ